MKNKTILVVLLIFGIMILSGCTDKGEQTNVPTNLITDDKGEVVKISENTENLFKEYTEDINNWKSINRGGDVYKDVNIQIAEESDNVEEGSKSIRIDYNRSEMTDYINSSTKKPNRMPRSGIDLTNQGSRRVNLSTWKDYNAISFWLFQPNIDTKARVYVHLVISEEGENYSVYDAGKEFDGKVTGWSHVIIPFSKFEWAEWSTLHYPFDPSKSDTLEISFDSDNPVQFTTYIDGFRPVKIE